MSNKDILVNDLNNIFNLSEEKNVECKIDDLKFEHAIKIYINKPQVVNKWVAGSIKLEITTENIKELLKDFKIDYDKYEFELREFISKSNKIFQNLKYLIIIDKENSLFLFYPLITENNGDGLKYASITLCHSFKYFQSKLYLYVSNNYDKSCKKIPLQIKWLSDNLMSKIHNWSLNLKTDAEFSCTKLNTLTLYDHMVNDYNSLYQNLKEKYWNKFSGFWFEMTSTDPEKFIHEDVSIACYFILVWKYFNVKVKCFVDLGCGNGLLVYILNDQGYNGYGIDMRKRRIWSNEHYEKAGTRLMEKTIDPRSDTYEECDWIIGNHSDELSPWLPIIALKSSRQCNFLLIPCCFFDFNCKFDVKKNNESRYDTYLKYLLKICDECNFKVYKDKLRIPSTRNVCLIAFQEELMQTNQTELPTQTELNEKINYLLSNNTANTTIEFKPRDLDMEKDKSSRNCTKNINNDLKVYILTKVLECLLKDNDELGENKCVFIDKHDGSKWNCGTARSLVEIANLFDKEILNKLKLECGGIKTLLKNYHQMFNVVNKDKVQVKVSTNENTTKSKQKSKEPVNAARLKTKNCLFDLYHPNGCLLEDSKCSFIHKSEIKTCE